MLLDGILLTCGGFILAVLWFDLMFDSQVRGHRDDELPEEVVASISAYYRRVTTTANPMGFLVGVAMLTVLATLATQFATGRAPPDVIAISAVLSAPVILLGLGRTLPNAIRLGRRSGSIAEQSALVRSIWRDHLLCFVGIALFVAYRLARLS